MGIILSIIGKFGIIAQKCNWYTYKKGFYSCSIDIQYKFGTLCNS